VYRNLYHNNFLIS